MSIPLQAFGRPLGTFGSPILGRIVEGRADRWVRADCVLRADRLADSGDVGGYAGVVSTDHPAPEILSRWREQGVALIHGIQALDHLAPGDVVVLHPSGFLRTLYRVGSPHNALFATDRCNSFCVMCSQPPKPVDDSDRIQEHLRLLDLLDPQPSMLGITGGEPTLLKGDFLRLIARCKERLPQTSLHVLTNGRLFAYGGFARRLAALDHPDLVLAIPLYADVPQLHDFVVQAAGAFEQTMAGIHNLGRYGVPIEIRVVLHRSTIPRLPQLAEFLYRNVPFAVHLALMGLEPMGFAAANLEELWVDPVDYQAELEAATLLLARVGMSVSIYNHQLCVVPESLWPYCRKSISDWKNEYLPECRGCAVQSRCGGFFASALKRRCASRQIRPLAGRATGGMEPEVP
jgi:His-Xaa-Ser system radical SAM maturase HxsC